MMYYIHPAESRNEPQPTHVDNEPQGAQSQAAGGIESVPALLCIFYSVYAENLK